MSNETKKKSTTRQIGAVLIAKEGGGFYIKLTSPAEFTVKVGDSEKKVKTQFINFDDPKESIKRLAKLGYITEEVAQTRLENLPSFVKYNLNVSVPQE